MSWDRHGGPARSVCQVRSMSRYSLLPSLARLYAPLNNISAPFHSAPTAPSVPTTTNTTFGHAIQLVSASSEQRNNKFAFSLATLQSLGLLLRRPYTSCPRRLLRCTVTPEHGETATTDDLEKSLCLGYPRTFEPRACIGIRDNFPLESTLQPYAAPVRLFRRHPLCPLSLAREMPGHTTT